jgi:hypothetical protein
MDTIYDQIRRILDNQGGAMVFSFGDHQYDLVWKILINLGGTPRFGDSEYDLWVAILKLTNPGAYYFGESLNSILSAIAGITSFDDDVLLRFIADNNIIGGPSVAGALTTFSGSPLFTFSNSPILLIA